MSQYEFLSLGLLGVIVANLFLFMFLFQFEASRFFRYAKKFEQYAGNTAPKYDLAEFDE